MVCLSVKFNVSFFNVEQRHSDSREGGSYAGNLKYGVMGFQKCNVYTSQFPKNNNAFHLLSCYTQTWSCYDSVALVFNRNVATATGSLS